MAEFLLYWKPETVGELDPAVIQHFATSDQFIRMHVARGDVLWAVTSRQAGDLRLVARIVVEQVTTSKKQAERLIDGGELWGGAHQYAIGRANESRVAQDIDISSLALDLRFEGKEDRLRPRFGGQNFQTMRRLTDESAAMLRKAWGGPALPLALHGRCGRAEVYELFNIVFSQRNRTLIRGLSPQLPDGGYYIFVTLDKSEMNEAYDYDDQLLADSLEWVTRRGVGEIHPDYVNLRRPETRVSLFVRREEREKFAYLGELRYETHREFDSDRAGQKQQQYLFRLEHRVPRDLLAELTGGVSAPVSSNRKGRHTSGAPSGRRPATLEGSRQALSYVLGDLNRVMVPAHHNYQVRLKAHLQTKQIEAEWERDFLDVTFDAAGRTFIGEIKVTTYLKRDEAFRVALGQLLFYGRLRFPNRSPGMVMFLDAEPRNEALGLANDLGIGIVVEREEGRFGLLNPTVRPELVSVFESVAVAEVSQ